MHSAWGTACLSPRLRQLETMLQDRCWDIQGSQHIHNAWNRDSTPISKIARNVIFLSSYLEISDCKKWQQGAVLQEFTKNYLHLGSGSTARNGGAKADAFNSPATLRLQVTNFILCLPDNGPRHSSSVGLLCKHM